MPSYRLSKDAGVRPKATAQQKAIFLEKTNAARRKIALWKDAQQVYMPGLAAYLVTQPAASVTPGSSLDEIKALSKLWLPSDIVASRRHAVCLGEIAKMEERLRVGQGEEAIGDLRNHLRVCLVILICTRN